MKKRIKFFVSFVLSYFVGYYLIYPYFLLSSIHLVNTYISETYFSTANYSTFADKIIFSITFAFFISILFTLLGNLKHKVIAVLLTLIFFIIRMSYIKFSFIENEIERYNTNTLWIGPIMLVSVILLVTFSLTRNKNRIK